MSKILDTVWDDLVEHFGVDDPRLSDHPQLTSARESRPGQGRRTHLLKRRSALVLSVAVAFGIIAFLAVSEGGRSVGVGTASARVVLGRTAAAISRSTGGVLHIDAVTYHGKYISYEIDSWSEQGRPYRYWATARYTKGPYKGSYAETRVGSTVVAYQSRGNEISIAHVRQAHVQLLDPLIQVIDVLNAASAFKSQVDIPIGSSIHTLQSFARILKEISHKPGVTVTRHATLHGVPAIKIKAANQYSTLYVNPVSYEPLGFATTGPEYGQFTTVFKTFATAKPSSVSVPNLVKKHPHAVVPKWDQRYWDRMEPTRS